MRLVNAHVVGEFGVMVTFASEQNPNEIQDYCVFTAVADHDGYYDGKQMEFHNMLGCHKHYSIEITEALEILNNQDSVDNQHSFELHMAKLANCIKEIEF